MSHEENDPKEGEKRKGQNPRNLRNLVVRKEFVSMNS